MSGVEGVGPGNRRPSDLAEPAAQDTPGSHRLLHLLGALLVGVVLPAVLVGALVGELGVSALFTGVVWGAVGAKLAGTRRMVYVTPLVGVVAGLGAYTAYDWWWVALLTTTGILAGVGFRFGWFAPLLMVPYAATFVTPVDTATTAVTFGAIVAIGTAYGLVIMRRFGAPAVVEGTGTRCPSPPSSRSASAHLGRRRSPRGGVVVDRAVLGAGADPRPGHVPDHGTPRAYSREGARHGCRRGCRRGRSRHRPVPVGSDRAGRSVFCSR